MSNCIVVFPLYQTPSELELSFLENGIRKTEGHKQVVVAPEGLNIDQSFGLLEKLEVKRFSKHFFNGISGYNQLLLSKTFYSSFKLFEYVLIHQADVYLFKNELSLWCEKDYDYIGAPWFRPDKLNKGKFFNAIQDVKLSFKKNKVYGQRYNKVGNGGLSLRKLSSALEVLDLVPQHLLEKYTKSEGDEYNEDIFWSLETPKILDNFKIPTWEEAMQFAVEFHPKLAYTTFLDKKLPFGCHAPLKHEPKFWQAFIPELKSV